MCPQWAFSRCFLLFFIGTLSYAQSGKPVTTFKSKAELVEIPVVVTSRGGTPVRGLHAEDFTVKSDGRPEAISVFHEVEAAAPSAACGSAPNVITNRPPTSGETLIVVIDLLNTRKVTKLHDSVLAVLEQLVADRVPASVLAIGKDGLVQLHAVCASTDHLKSVITALTAEENDAAEAIRAAHLDEGAENLIRDLRGKKIPSHNFEVVRRIDFRATTFLAVEQIFRGFSPLKGRKKLIWLGQNLPAYLQPLQLTDGRDLFDYKNTFRLVAEEDKNPSDNPERSERFERWRRSLLLWKRLNDANFRVMPILDEVPTAEPSGAVPRVFGVAMPSQTASTICDEVYSYTYDPHLAERIPDVCYNDTEGCLRKALADRHYYVVGFYLKHEVKPGVHGLDVHVTDKSTKVYSRQGFLVPGDKLRLASATPAPSNNPYDAPRFTTSIFSWTFLASPLDSADVPLSVEWSLTRDAEGVTSISYKLSASPNEISIDPTDLSVNLHIATYARRPVDDPANLQEHAFVQRLTLEQQQQLVTNGFVYKGHVQLTSDSTAIRFLLRDDNTGRVGTVTVSFD